MMERIEEREEKSEGLKAKTFYFTLLKMVVETETMIENLMQVHPIMSYSEVNIGKTSRNPLLSLQRNNY